MPRYRFRELHVEPLIAIRELAALRIEHLSAEEIMLIDYGRSQIRVGPATGEVIIDLCLGPQQEPKRD